MSLKTVDWGSQDDRGPVFRARYPGHCEGCGEEFDPDEEVFYLNGDIYIDHDCAADDDSPRPKTCPSCFQIFSASGACGC